jgi:3D (Asp-Asp-Asp) domain-containing protein
VPIGLDKTACRPERACVSPRVRIPAWARLLACGFAFAVIQPPGLAVAAGGPTGGAGLGSSGGSKMAKKVPPPPSKHTKGKWASGYTLTQYWPSPEAWFVGRLVTAPGLPGKYPIDWLYSATGVSMQGEGVTTSGQFIHINAFGSAGWVTSKGKPTHADDDFAAGAPYWRAGGYWRNRSGAVTFPLRKGGWSSGTGKRYVPLRGVTFARGASLPLRYDQSIAVDPGVIPLGSRVYIPAYKKDGYGGWFLAQDTGGAVGGRHIDVYISPPSSRLDTGTTLTGQRVFVERAKG